MKLLGYILLACLAVAALQYALAVLLALALVGALLTRPKETLALLGLGFFLNAVAVHPIPALVGLAIALAAGIVLHR